MVKEIITETKNIRFEKSGYSQDWNEKVAKEDCQVQRIPRRH
jgi:glutamine synthetase type III